MAGIWRHLAIFLIGLVLIGTSKGQTQPAAMAVDQGNAVFTFNIPPGDAGNIYVKLDPENGAAFGQHTARFFLSKPNVVRIYAGFQSKMEAELNNLQVKVTIRPVNVSDAGFYRCYTGPTEASLLQECGRRLIVLRPPDDPTITAVAPDNTLLVGKPLRLSCESRSNSGPPSHGLGRKVSWKDVQGNEITTGSRFYLSNGELRVDKLVKGDRDLQFFCQVADDTMGQFELLWSSSGNPYTVEPEYFPTQSDLKVSPSIEEGATISRKIGGSMEYRCEVDCNPPCEVNWMYKADTTGAMYSNISGLQDPSVLVKKDLGRWDPGSYRCLAKNKHSESPVSRTFHMELLYLEPPLVYINSQKISNASVWEQRESVEFKCEFDANPKPVIKWKTSSGQTLQSTDIEGPRKQVNPFTKLPESVFTSTLFLASLTCEDAGVYTCLGRSEDAEFEGRMNLNVKCRPMSSELPGESLLAEYAWEIPEPVKFEFVIRGWPAPKIDRISSSLNGETRNEVLGTDMLVSTESPHKQKQWLTLVKVQSRRPLTQEDSGRRFTLEFFSSDYTTNFEFSIRLRGPPHQVHNITLEKVSHDSVEVFWRAGFDGGEEQTFSVEYRKEGKDGEETTSEWKVAVKDVRVMPQGLWQTADVKGLHSSTAYQGRIVASSILGSTVTEFSFKTTAAPSGGLSAGAVVGIVFACIIFVIIVVVALYWFVLRKRLGKGGPDFSIKGMRDTLKKLIKRDEDKPTRNGGVSLGSDQPKKTPIYRVKKMVKKIPQKLKKDYNTVPVRDAEDDDDYSADEFDHDDTYMNAGEALKPRPDETVYANASAIRKNAQDKKKNEGREMNEDGLIYVTVDHKNSSLTPPKNNNNNRASPKKASPEPAVLFKPQDDMVEYSDIDFTTTPLKNGIHQEVRAEVNPALKQVEADVAGVQPEKDDAASAADGGADVEAADGGADLSAPSGGVVPESKFGTAV